MNAAKDSVPRGAIAVVIVGLVLSVVTALLTIDEDEGGERIDWELSAEIPGSGPSSLGSEGSLEIADAKLDATRDNASGYSLFRVSGTAILDLGGYEGRSQARCTVRVPPRSVLARTPGKRAAYPLPSEDLRSQAVPELSVIRFNAKGSDLVGVEVEDAFDQFTNGDPVKVDWAPYREGEQTWEWVLDPADRSEPVRLAFMTMWRTTERAGGRIVCAATAGGDSARAATSGSVG
jgi:hypothetical protein